MDGMVVEHGESPATELPRPVSNLLKILKYSGCSPNFNKTVLEEILALIIELLFKRKVSHLWRWQKPGTERLWFAD